MNPDPPEDRPQRKPEGLSWEGWVEQQIQDALARGEFDNLPGAGKPLPNRRNPYLPEDRQLAYDLIQNSGYTLPWIEDAKQIERRTDAARQTLRQQHEHYLNQIEILSAAEAERLNTTWDAQRQAFAQELAEINRLIDIYNLKAPSARLHKFRLILSEELSRLASDT